MAVSDANVIKLLREWYVDEIKHQLSGYKNDFIYKNIKDEFKNETKKQDIKNADFDAITKANEDGAKLLSEGMNLPIGLTMKAYNVTDNGNAYPDNDINAWNETVTISINQEPNHLYLNAKDSPTKLKSLGVRSISVFGGVGLPLLPPLIPWFATLNIWTIEVQGEKNKFVVQDIDNEVHPETIFGHGAQVHVRDNADVYDDAVTTLQIGNNKAIKFSFVTGTFIIVPPKNIGDIDYPDEDDRIPNFEVKT